MVMGMARPHEQDDNGEVRSRVAFLESYARLTISYERLRGELNGNLSIIKLWTEPNFHLHRTMLPWLHHST